MLKFSAIILYVSIVLVNAEIPIENAPYRSSGWKPEGPRLPLPTEPELQRPNLDPSYGPPPIGRNPAPEYGPPTRNNYRDKESVENPNVEFLRLNQLQRYQHQFQHQSQHQQPQRVEIRPIYREIYSHYHHHHHHDILPERYVLATKSVYPTLPLTHRDHVDVIDPVRVRKYSPYVLRYQLHL